MNTKIVMMSSAIVLGVLGVTLTFIPEEIMIYFDLEPSKIIQITLQLLGALYFAFAMLNWMSKSSLIGGVYNRPTAIANFTHFFISALALIKGYMSSTTWAMPLVVITVVYSIFAVLFFIIFRSHPISEKEN